MEKKSYLGYVPKKSNVQKLKQYVQGTGQQSVLPNSNPVKLNKRK